MTPSVYNSKSSHRLHPATPGAAQAAARSGPGGLAGRRECGYGRGWSRGVRERLGMVMWCHAKRGKGSAHVVSARRRRLSLRRKSSDSKAACEARARAVHSRHGQDGGHRSRKYASVSLKDVRDRASSTISAGIPSLPTCESELSNCSPQLCGSVGGQELLVAVEHLPQPVSS